jgi:hypothetical protein
MAEITLVRQQPPRSRSPIAAARTVLFGIIDGLGEQGRSSGAGSSTA